MRRTLLGTLVAGATMAATAGLTVVPANAAAAPPWTLSRTGSFTATNVGNTVLKNNRNGVQISCTGSTGSGNIPDLVSSDNEVALITGLGFSGCTGLGIAFSVATGASTTTPFSLNAVTPTATGANGNVSGISATLTGPGCTVSVSGPAPGTNNGVANGTYTNSTSRLQMTGTGNLTVRSVSGCFGLMLAGDSVGFTGLYQVSPAVTITG